MNRRRRRGLEGRGARTVDGVDRAHVAPLRPGGSGAAVRPHGRGTPALRRRGRAAALPGGRAARAGSVPGGGPCGARRPAERADVVARAPRPTGPAADRLARGPPPGRCRGRGGGHGRDARQRRPPRPDPRGDHGGRDRQQLHQREDTAGARPDLLPQCGRRGRGPARDPRLCGGVRPVRAAARRLVRRRRRRGLTGVRFGGRVDGAPDDRRRAAPLRLERLLQRAHARRTPRRARRVAAALPGAARSAQLERAHLRHSSRPARAPAAQEHHPGRAERQGRLLPPAHAALRPGRAVPVLPGRGRRSGRTGRHRPARPRHVRRDAGLRDRPGPAVHGLRRVVAPHPEHVDHQRVGHPVDDRGRGGA